MHSDQSALRFSMVNKDAKQRLISIVSLLQEIDFDVMDRKWTKNQLFNHLSRLEAYAMRTLGEKDEISDVFPYKHILTASHDLVPWFSDFDNYLETYLVSSYLTFHQRKKFPHDVKNFFWDELYLYWSCVDGIILRCLAED